MPTPAAQHPLPLGWREYATKAGRPYYYHAASKEKSWVRPTGNAISTAAAKARSTTAAAASSSATAAIWKEYATKTGRPYYVNTVTKVKSWERPSSMDDADASAGASAAAPATPEASPEKAATWKEYATKAGRPYFVNMSTKEKTWVRPPSLGGDASPAAAAAAAAAPALPAKPKKKKGKMRKTAAEKAAENAKARLTVQNSKPSRRGSTEMRSTHGGWKEARGADGRVYWHNRLTKQKTFKKPPGFDTTTRRASIEDLKGLAGKTASPSTSPSAAAVAAERVKAKAKAEADAQAATTVVWIKHIDDTTGRSYYSNPATKERAWTLPAGATAVSEETVSEVVWVEHLDETSLETVRYYFSNPTTGARVWTLPDGAKHTPAPERAAAAAAAAAEAELEVELAERQAWVRDRNVEHHAERAALRQRDDDERERMRALGAAQAKRRQSLQAPQRSAAANAAAVCALAAAAAAEQSARRARDMVRRRTTANAEAAAAAEETKRLKMAKAVEVASAQRAEAAQRAQALAAAEAASATASSSSTSMAKAESMGAKLRAHREAKVAAAARAAAAPAPGREALLFGNSSCVGRAPLRCAKRNLDTMCRALEEDGFHTTSLHDSSASEMDEALIEFMLRCGEMPQGTAALVYFTGFAAVLRSGVAYFIPADKRVGARAQAEQRGLSIADALALVSTALPNAPATVVAVADVCYVALEDSPAVHIERSVSLPPLRLAAPVDAQCRVSLFAAFSSEYDAAASGSKPSRLTEAVVRSLQIQRSGGKRGNADLAATMSAASDVVKRDSSGAQEAALQVHGDSSSTRRGSSRASLAARKSDETVDAFV